MPTGKPKNIKIDPNCPPLLRQLIEQEGSRAAVAKLIKAGTNTINEVARGNLEMSDSLRQRLEAALTGGAPTEEAPEPEVTIPPWDKKTVTFKIKRKDGKTTTFNKFPQEMVALMDRHDNVMGRVAVELGWSGWGGIQNALDSGKYEAKVHPRVYAALNGLPIRQNGNSGSEDQDTHRLGIAVCVVALSEYERLEELAEVMGGHRVFRMPSGQGTIVMYAIADRKKRETFKRLASRDAKKIVCP